MTFDEATDAAKLLNDSGNFPNRRYFAKYDTTVESWVIACSVV